MLKLRRRQSQNWKCPLHPRAKYTVSEGLRAAACTTCRAIFEVLRAAGELDEAEHRAYMAISHTRLKSGPNPNGRSLESNANASAAPVDLQTGDAS